MTPQVIARWLTHRHTPATTVRKPGRLQTLAKRSALMNSRLSHEWLCYLVTKGAYQQADGWRWKLDPTPVLACFWVMRSRWMTDRFCQVPSLCHEH